MRETVTSIGARFIFMNTGEDSAGDRSWDDCRKYGFISSGGNTKYQSHARSLKVGDRILAYLNKHGYVGIGEVIAEAVPERDFIPPGQSKRLFELPLTNKRLRTHDDLSACEYCVAVKWIYTVDRGQAVLKHRARRPTSQVIKQPDLVEAVFEKFGLRLDGSCEK